MERQTYFLKKWGSLFLGLFLIAGCSSPYASKGYRPAVWLTDFEEAKIQARQLRFPILAAFVGLDWCPWCQKLEEEVFSQKEFLAYAEDRFVLFRADYPRQEEQPAEIKKQNQALARIYAIEAFPTVLILDSEGKKLAETGYRRGGVKAYLEHLERLRGK